jgi:hypothetical protein
MFVTQGHRIEAQPSIRPTARLSRESANTQGSSLRYNSLEFVYRPEFRQLVLLDQDPETGEKIAQVPSEYRLKLYAAANVQSLTKPPTSEEGAGGTENPLANTYGANANGPALGDVSPDASSGGTSSGASGVDIIV